MNILKINKNISNLSYPAILQQLLVELDRYNATAVPPANLPLDPKADPRFWDNVWMNFGDYE